MATEQRQRAVQYFVAKYSGRPRPVQALDGVVDASGASNTWFMTVNEDYSVVLDNPDYNNFVRPDLNTLYFVYLNMDLKTVGLFHSNILAWVVPRTADSGLLFRFDGRGATEPNFYAGDDPVVQTYDPAKVDAALRDFVWHKVKETTGLAGDAVPPVVSVPVTSGQGWVYNQHYDLNPGRCRAFTERQFDLFLHHIERGDTDVVGYDSTYLDQYRDDESKSAKLLFPLHTPRGQVHDWPPLHGEAPICSKLRCSLLKLCK